MTVKVFTQKMIKDEVQSMGERYTMRQIRGMMVTGVVVDVGWTMWMVVFIVTVMRVAIAL